MRVSPFASVLVPVLAALACSPQVDYTDLDRNKRVETLSGDERDALCRETERVFSAPAVVDFWCFEKDHLDRSGTEAEVRFRCESQQRRCREQPVIPLDCRIRERCPITVADYDRCLGEMARTLERVAKEISCAA